MNEKHVDKPRAVLSSGAIIVHSKRCLNRLRICSNTCSNMFEQAREQFVDLMVIFSRDEKLAIIVQFFYSSEIPEFHQYRSSKKI